MNRKDIGTSLAFLLFWIVPFISVAQVDHYETIIYEFDIWRYRSALSEPPGNWMLPGFDDSSWQQGPGGFGYGDDDDNVNLSPTNGVYMRIEFDLVDMAAVQDMILDIDYDDAFVAYLNGVEVARENIGVQGIPPSFDDQPYDYHEAVMYEGGIPERFELVDDIPLLVEEGNVLAVHVLNHSINSSDLSSRVFLSLGLSSTGIIYGETPDWFQTPVFISSSKLPIIVIDTDGETIPDEPEIPAFMGIINNGPGNLNFINDPFNDYEGDISIEIRGTSSQDFPKKQYRIETRTPEGENNNVPLLGMPAENDWVLNGPYSDKSLIRNVIAYEISARTGRYTPRYQLCEVIINGTYQGVYLWLEKIKRDVNRVDIATVTETDLTGDELTGGYILQIDRENEGTVNGWYSYEGDWPYFYSLEEPNYEEAHPVQREYIRSYIEEMENDLNGPNLHSTYQEYLDIGSFIDYFLVNEIGKHIDVFKLSFYMYKRKDSNGGKLFFGPVWDFNLAFGNFDFACDPSPTGWIYPCSSPVTWVEQVVSVTDVQDSMYCRWTELRESVWSTESIMEFIDTKTEELQEAKDRNFTRWNVMGTYVWPNDFIGLSYEDEINFLKNFIQVRLEWMDQNMYGQGAECGINTSVFDGDENQEKVKVYPNPASDWLRFSSGNHSPINGLLRIFSPEGKLMLKHDFSQSELGKIDVSSWAEGIYLYNFSLDKSIKTAGSFVVQ